MNDYFIWNGVDCRSFGIHVSELPPRTIPVERTTQTNVPGRPGSLTTTEGQNVYDDLLLTAQCFISGPAMISGIAAWLKGSGTVTFADRTGRYYKARIANQIPFEKILRGSSYCSFAVTFRCFPFVYVDNVADITVTTSGDRIDNNYGWDSEPLLKVYGSGDIVLMVGAHVVELDDITDRIDIDCELKEAYNGTTLMNEHMVGDFPVLVPGYNAISWTGNVTKVVVKPRWRSL